MRVYVAGPYSADNVIDVLKNIGRGQDVCAHLFSLGFSPFCPWHDKDFVITGYRNGFTLEQFYQYSLDWLSVSDCIVLIGKWWSSKGTMAEIEYAKEHCIPIYDGVKNLLENKEMKWPKN